MRVRTLLTLTAAALLPAAALAQAELSALVGYRGGDSAFLVEADAPLVDCLLPPCVVARARTPESEVLGLVLDLPLAGGWMAEALVNRQQANLRLAAPPGLDAGPLGAERFELTTLQVGLLHRWRPVAGGLEPFVAGGVGLARVESSAAVLTRPVRPGEPGRRLAADEVFAASLGGGARLALGRRLGLRLEGRGYRTELPRELGGALVQFELSAGLTARL